MTPAPKRRWFRYSLRTMFLAITFASMCMAWVMYERRQSTHEFQIVDQLRASNGAVDIQVVGLFDTVKPSWISKRESSWWRVALSGLCGPRIRSIGFDRNPSFSDLSPLAGLKRLQSLNVQNTQVSDLAPLAALKHLDAVNLCGTQVTDLSPLAGLKELKAIGLDNTKVSDLSPLAELEKLEELSLDRTRVRYLAPLAKLKNLQVLYAELTPVSDVSPLAALKNLKTVGLTGTQVHFDRAEMLQTSLPNCQVTGWPSLGLKNLQVSERYKTRQDWSDDYDKSP